jgi:acyl-CoA reductase-like NAD-dependent aldehyde dehydrogenase
VRRGDRITPFNYPGRLLTHKVASTLAARNAAVLKPAELTPLAALLLPEWFHDADLPGEVPSVITGHGCKIDRAAGSAT